MLKLKNGPADVADAAHRAGIAKSFPGGPHAVRGRSGRSANNGIVLGQYQTRVLDMASAYATVADSGMYHAPHFVQKVVNAAGEVLFDASAEDNTGERRIEGGRRQRHRRHATDRRLVQRAQPRRWRPSAAKTGTNQLGDTGANRDAWMVGYTPSLSTAVWVGTVDGTKPLVNAWGGPVYGSGIPSDIWKATMDGALKGTDVESFEPAEVGGYAGCRRRRPAPAAPPLRRVRRSSSRVSKWRRASRSRLGPRRRCRSGTAPTARTRCLVPPPPPGDPNANVPAARRDRRRAVAGHGVARGALCG